MEGVGEMRTKAGVPYNNDYCLIYRLKDGKIVEIREYCDSALTEKILGKYPTRQLLDRDDVVTSVRVGGQNYFLEAALKSRMRSTDEANPKS